MFDGVPAIVELVGTPLVVGRDTECGLRIDLRCVSREHARLVVARGGATSIIDLSSRNGTFVNGQRVSASLLSDGDIVHFGPDAAFRFTTDASALNERGLPRCRADHLPRLSAREREVAELVARGLHNSAIAERLTIRPRTVATHLEHIFAKLAIGSRAELMLRMIAGRTPDAR